MKILFFGDSITDAVRDREGAWINGVYGTGFVMQVVGRLFEKDPKKYEIVNRGISGNRIVDLYARIKQDVWNEQPDVLNILVGINDIWHEVKYQNGVGLERWERMYRILIQDTLQRLPNTKIIICEPFCLKGLATAENYEEFCKVRDYAKVAKKLAQEYGLYFLPLQKAFDEAAEKYAAETFLFDGVHPTVQGAVVLAKEWLKLFEKIEKQGE